MDGTETEMRVYRVNLIGINVAALGNPARKNFSLNGNMTLVLFKNALTHLENNLVIPMHTISDSELQDPQEPPAGFRSKVTVPNTEEVCSGLTHFSNFRTLNPMPIPIPFSRPK